MARAVVARSARRHRHSPAARLLVRCALAVSVAALGAPARTAAAQAVRTRPPVSATDVAERAPAGSTVRLAERFGGPRRVMTAVRYDGDTLLATGRRFGEFVRIPLAEARSLDVQRGTAHSTSRSAAGVGLGAAAGIGVGILAIAAKSRRDGAGCYGSPFSPTSCGADRRLLLGSVLATSAVGGVIGWLLPTPRWVPVI